MTRGGFRGEWWTDSGSGVLPVLVILALALIGGGGAAAALAPLGAALFDIAVAAGVLTVAGVAGVSWFLVYRFRHPGWVPRLVPHLQYHDLGAPELPAIDAKPQRPQIVQNFYGGNHVHTGAADAAPVVRGEIDG